MPRLLSLSFPSHYDLLGLLNGRALGSQQWQPGFKSRCECEHLALILAQNKPHYEPEHWYWPACGGPYQAVTDEKYLTWQLYHNNKDSIREENETSMDDLGLEVRRVIFLTDW